MKNTKHETTTGKTLRRRRRDKPVHLRHQIVVNRSRVSASWCRERPVYLNTTSHCHWTVSTVRAWFHGRIWFVARRSETRGWLTLVEKLNRRLLEWIKLWDCGTTIVNWVVLSNSCCSIQCSLFLSDVTEWRLKSLIKKSQTHRNTDISSFSEPRFL